MSELIVKKIKEIANEISQRFEIEIEEMGYDQDHIHLLCSFHPKYAGGEVVRIFKSIVARELFRQFPGLKQELWGGEFWSDGYYLGTISERGDLKTLERYVQEQGKTPKEVQLKLI